MIKLFSIVINMSITASIVILAVIVLRLMFSRTPKIFSYLLWMVVLIRLLYPVSLEADFGFLPNLDTVKVESAVEDSLSQTATHNYAPEEVADGVEVNEKNAYTEVVEEYVNGVPGTDSNEDVTYIYNTGDVKIGEGSWSFVLPYEIAGILSVVWLIVGGVLLLYEILSYSYFVRRLKKQQSQILPEEEKVLVLENISTPFVAGIFRPVVYLPAGMDEVQKELVTAHEKNHIKRLDYLVKPLFLIACCVHWFNPFVWLAFWLMIRDMESSCDEAVLQEIGYERKKEYAYTLLELARERKWKVGYPLAFGENHVQSRVKNVVKAKKNAIWVVAAVAFVAGMATVLLLVNRQNKEESIIVVDGDAEAGYQLAEEQTGEEQADVQFLPNEEITVTEVPGTDSNEDATMHEYYTPDEENEIIDTDGTMAHLSEELEQGNTNSDTSMNYEPDKDKFAVLLLESPGAYNDLEILYRYPVEGASVSSAFGTRIHPITQEEKVHSGVDFAAEEGTPVMAAADGTVVKTGFDVENGNYVIIQHSNGDVTYYTACKEILTQEGSEVSAGDQIATVGSTGTSAGPHLHFAVSRKGEFIEPEFRDK